MRRAHLDLMEMCPFHNPPDWSASGGSEISGGYLCFWKKQTVYRYDGRVFVSPTFALRRLQPPWRG